MKRTLVIRSAAVGVVVAAGLTVGLLTGGTRSTVASANQFGPTSDTCTRVINADGSTDIHCPPLPTTIPSTTPTDTPAPTTTPPVTTTPPTTTIPPTPTTPPSPTVGPTFLNCLNSPSACGYPDLSNTGPRGTLTALSGNLSITTPNTIIDSKKITGCVVIDAASVTIKNSQIINTCGWAVKITPNGVGSLIIDTEVSCSNTQGKAIVIQRQATVDRAYLHGCEDMVYLDHAGTVQNSYMGGFWHGADGHTDAVQLTEGGADGGVNMLHNTAINQDAQGSSVLSADTAAFKGPIRIDNNLVAGGGYSFRCSSDREPSFTLTNNRINPKYTQYGPWTQCSNVTTSGNVNDVTGAKMVP